MDDIIELIVGIVDERLSLAQYLAEARRQTEAMPLKIIQDDKLYTAFDCRLQVRGDQNIMIAYYRVEGPKDE